MTVWRHLDLFSGIGGFALAAAWTGRIETIGFCESDPWCRRVIAKHWPGVPIHDDIKTLDAETVQEWLAMRGAKRKDYSEAVALYEAGSSIRDIAECYGITRQAMHTILKRRGVEMRSNLRYGADNHFYRGGPNANDEAHNLVETAIQMGALVPKACEVCGTAGTFKDGRRSV